jgi:hypothetical protein
MEDKIIEQQFQIHFPVFDYSVYIIVSENIWEARHKRVKKLGLEEEDESRFIRAMHCCAKKLPDSYIFMTPDITPGQFAHECSHAIARLFEWTGMKFEDEAFAYHLGYLIDQFDEIQLKKTKKTEDNGTDSDGSI